MKVRIGRLATGSLLLATAFLACDSACASATRMSCEIGPITRQIGGTSWLVYGCADNKSVLIVSAPSNKAVHFRFSFTADDDGYSLHGEGQGDKHVSDAAYQELNAMSAEGIAALVSATHRTTGSGVQAQAVDTKPAADAGSQSSLISAERTIHDDVYRQLLDPKVSLQERQSAFAEVEASAQAGVVQAQYVTGSLYRIGRALPASPVEQDLAKARLYLSNAAAHGEILAMAKMAELEAASKNQMSAMTWAQIYAHYAMLQPEERRPSNGYLAELVERASRGIQKSQLQDVVDNLNAFIAAHDDTVRPGSEQVNTLPPDMAPDFRRDQSMPFRSSDSVPNAGFADYLLTFKPDGSTRDVLLLDAIPDVKLGQVLRGSFYGYRVGQAPSSDKAALRLAFVPVMFDDERYRLKPKDRSK